MIAWMMLNGVTRRWRMDELAPVDDAQVATLASQLRISPLVAALLVKRGHGRLSAAERFCKPALSHLHDPAALPGCSRAADRLMQAVQDKQPIIIYGDYDVDGITATAILYHTLRMAGGQVQTYVPHRIEEGYGLNIEAITQLCQPQGADGKQPLIVSVDCGITAVEPARVAREADVDLIITDHHEFDPAHLPQAYALVHPRLPGETAYPFADLCGAGVAFKIAWQFAKTWCGSDRLPEDFKTLMIDLLSLAALGTIADVVPLVDENRILTRYGLGRIKFTRFIGLNALIDAANLRDEKIDCYHVGFVLGPRLNSCGRMGHAKTAVQLLTEAQPEEAAQIARFLQEENDKRRATERQIFHQAEQLALEEGYDSTDQRVIVMAHEDWHPGVLGIVASRMVERFHRPAVMLAISTDENGQRVASGSARSVDRVSIHEALNDCAQYLSRFGGHAMAAGMQLDAENINAFRDALVACVNEKLAAEDVVCESSVDMVCELDDLSISVFEQIESLAPFGRSNHPPLLCLRDVMLDEPGRSMGATGKHLRLWLRGNNGKRIQAVAFGFGEDAHRLPRGTRIDVIFEPKISTWNNQRRGELHVKDWRYADALVTS